MLEYGAHVIIYDVLFVPKSNRRLLKIAALISKDSGLLLEIFVDIVSILQIEWSNSNDWKDVNIGGNVLKYWEKK